jgi:hypothetical protein
LRLYKGQALQETSVQQLVMLPKRRFTYRLRGACSQKMETFITNTIISVTNLVDAISHR